MYIIGQVQFRVKSTNYMYMGIMALFQLQFLQNVCFPIEDGPRAGACVLYWHISSFLKYLVEWQMV